MNTIAQETTERSPMVRSEQRPAPVQPRQYSYDFADQRDAQRIAALCGTRPLAEVRASLAGGNDEWIVARRGGVVVAAVCVRAEGIQRTQTIETPAVAEEHRRCGLERYLTHLADVWLRAVAVPAAA